MNTYVDLFQIPILCKPDKQPFNQFFNIFRMLIFLWDVTARVISILVMVKML